jgi:hypothetical protein
VKTLEIKQAQSGQAIIEYILLFAIILSMAGLIVGGLSKTRDKMWKGMLCEVSAACPTCRSTDSAKTIFPSSGARCKN